MIRRLAARGVKQKDIAEKVGLDRSVVTKIINRDVQNAHEPTVNATTPAAEIESLQRKLEEAEAARRSTEQRLSAVQSVPSSRGLSATLFRQICLNCPGSFLAGTLQFWRVRDGSKLSAPAQMYMRRSHSFTVRTMSGRYHARKEYRHGYFHADHSLLAGVSCNDTPMNARTMRNES